MDMNLYSDFRNALFNLESGWPYYYWFKENVRKLNELKEFAYNNKKEFINAGIDLDEVYRQIDTFADKAMKKETITGNFDEGLIATALEYAKSGKPIINSKENDLAGSYLSTQEQEISSVRYYYDVLVDFVMYYLLHKENPACVDKIAEIFDELIPISIKMFNATNEVRFNSTAYVIQYLKILKKNKAVEDGEKLFNKYSLMPNTPKEKETLEKLREYFCIKKLK